MLIFGPLTYYVNLRKSITTNFKTETYHVSNKIRPPITLLFYKDYPVPQLKQTWITSILLNPHYMLLKMLFSMVNITTSGYTNPELESTCHIHITILPMYPLYSTHKLEICPLNFTSSMIINLKLSKGMQSLNHFGNIKPNVWKKLLNNMNSTLSQQNHMLT